jgi:hypothetical protein
MRWVMFLEAYHEDEISCAGLQNLKWYLLAHAHFYMFFLTSA